MRNNAETSIRILGPDDKISEPGFYQLPIERHHNQPCDGVSVTSSVLTSMAIYGPEHTWAFSALNKNRYLRDETDALREGRAMAAFVEGGMTEVERHFHVLPNDKPRRPTSVQMAAYEAGHPTPAGLKSINFWRKVENDPRTLITEAQFDLIHEMGKVLSANPVAKACLDGVPEITMAWFDEASDLWVLSRPDVLSFSGMISDYKKVNLQNGPMTPNVIDGRITRYRIDMQMGLACEAFQHLTGEWVSTIGLVFQSDAPPYSVMPRGISEQDARIGAFECARQRKIFRQCLDSGDWPGPDVDVADYRRPDWQAEYYEKEMA